MLNVQNMVASDAFLAVSRQLNVPSMQIGAAQVDLSLDTLDFPVLMVRWPHLAAWCCC